MKKRLSYLILTLPFVLLFNIFFHQIAFASFSAATTQSLAPMLQKVLPAVVNIKAIIKVTDFSTMQELAKQRRSNQQNNSDESNEKDQPLPTTFLSVGSGIIYDAKKGYIITNAHVVNDAQSMTVTLSDGRHFNAKTIGIDKPSDIALLQIKGSNFTALTFGDSNNVKVGDFIAAIGSPFGLSQSVTSGIVSAMGRSMLGIESYENFIQIDAPINPGNSGGALINMQGELIGVNTAILAPNRGNIGIGFAIPANMAKSVIEQLIEFGNVKRGVLGIGVQDVTPELATAFNIGDVSGAVVTQVIPHTPAQQVGLQTGDIITAINNSAIKHASDVVNTIGFLRVDTRVNVAILRNNKKTTVTIPLSDPKISEKAAEDNDPFLYGVALKNFTVFSPIHGKVRGVQVVSVQEDSNAWHSDLRMGDVITSVNQQKINNLEELKAAAAKANKKLLLNVFRGGGAMFLVINSEI